MVTKKDFNKVAELIQKNTCNDTFVIKNYLVNELCDYFESINPNFHRGKFIHACHNDMTRKYNVNIKAS